MKLSSVFTALVIVIGLQLESCKEDRNDPCKDVTCLNGGVCANGNCVCDEFYYGQLCGTRCVNGDFDGTCSCDDGYEGETCETEVREKFLGNFQVHEGCLTSSQTYNYTSSITAGTQGIRSIEISNFRDDEDYLPVVATIVGDTALLIEAQYPKGSQQVSGTGYINATRDTVIVDYEFKASAGGAKEICTLKFY